ncbi:uncharacterized protein LOC106090702 [Stomoxys calcitrans]|uniref:Secreted protein n=1 Tax=Stomoxys calcitrans TaxID=35570 RepID=A0A1I8NMU2_STOCA|nr:uncharacterized protein LOC106090702 [Stomoxys calcitrans]
MANKFFGATVSLWLLVTLVHVSHGELVEKSLLQAVATNNQRLGRAAQCVADLFEDAEVQTKCNTVVEGGIGFLRGYKGKTLTDEGYINLANLVIMTAVTNMQGVHPKCASAGDSYTVSNTPSSGANLSKTGGVFVRIGDVCDCLIKKGDNDLLAKVPAFYAKIIEGLASDTGADLVDVLYKHESTLANDLASLSGDCK